VHRPTAVGRTTSAVYSNLPLAIPPLVFFGMLRLWRARGRDPQLASIATQYEPPDQMTPAELGTLIDGKPDMRDITATIVDLAVRGFVHITETDTEHLFGLYSSKDYTFELKKQSGEWGVEVTRRHVAAMFGSNRRSACRISRTSSTSACRVSRTTSTACSCARSSGRRTACAALHRRRNRRGRRSRGAQRHDHDQLRHAAALGVVAGILSRIIILFSWFMPSRTIRAPG
jgi:hypothetical protein